MVNIIWFRLIHVVILWPPDNYIVVGRDISALISTLKELQKIPTVVTSSVSKLNIRSYCRGLMYSKVQNLFSLPFLKAIFIYIATEPINCKWKRNSWSLIDVSYSVVTARPQNKLSWKSLIFLSWVVIIQKIIEFIQVSF